MSLFYLHPHLPPIDFISFVSTVPNDNRLGREIVRFRPVGNKAISSPAMPQKHASTEETLLYTYHGHL
jgi:hypothetical protein